LEYIKYSAKLSLAELFNIKQEKIKMIITEKQYDYFNEISDLVNGSFDDSGNVIEKGLYSEPVYELNAPLQERKDGTLYIVHYEIIILDAEKFKDLQTSLGQLIALEEKI
jgi:hypothetical protein